MKGQPSISSIYRMAPGTANDDALAEWGRIERLRREAWRKTGVVTIRIEELPESLQGPIQQWAEDQYGRR